MDVILDTNILREDISLRRDEVAILNDYLYKSKSSIILPSIVLEEAEALYKKELLDKISSFNNAVNNINPYLEQSNNIQRIRLNIDQESSSYINRIKEKLNITSDCVIQYKDSYLGEVARRAIHRKKPCKESGDGFRDAVIWLTVLDYAQQLPIKPVAFISSNINDFGDRNAPGFHPQLLKEVSDLGLEVKYFASLTEFLREHKDHVIYITEDWLLAQLDATIFGDSLVELLNKEDDEIDSWCEKRFSQRERSNFYNIFSFYTHSVLNYDVYELAGGEIIINAEISGEIEIELEFYREKEAKPKPTYRMVIHPITGEVDIDFDLEGPSFDYPEYEALIEEWTPEIILDVTLIVKEKKVQEVKLKSFSLY